jgi:hypothetical protein
MEKSNTKITKLQRYWSIVRHGLLLFGIRNRLAKIGFDINPYYWVQEEFTACEEPKIKGNPSEYIFRYLDIDEVKLITNQDINFDREEMIQGLKNGQLCVGLEHNKEIAAFMFIEWNDFVYSNRTFKLKENEAYLLNMWVFHSYRSKNLAPYLRYQSYQLLKNQGRNVKYSITQYFNKSSILFKNKLNSKHLKLYISIVFFKKYYFNFCVREYK